LSHRYTSKNPSTPQGKRGRLRKKEEPSMGENELLGNQGVDGRMILKYNLEK
jgi:hypothetical protein